MHLQRKKEAPKLKLCEARPEADIPLDSGREDRWQPDRAGPDTDRLKDVMDYTTMMPFRRWAQVVRMLRSEPSALQTGPEATQELYQKYQEYRQAFSRKQMIDFFNANKHESWFVEKYSIGEKELKARLARRKRGRQGNKATWLSELRNGELDKVCWEAKQRDGDPPSESPSKLVAYDRKGEAEELDANEAVTIPADPSQIIVKLVPPEFDRIELEQALKEEPGFLYLAMGEPHQGRRYSRIGWAVFEEGTAMEELVERLNQRSIGGHKLAFELTIRPAQGKLRIAPEHACSLRRMAQDLEHARALVSLLEKEDREVLWKDEREESAGWLDVDASTEIERRCDNVGLGLGSDPTAIIHELAGGGAGAGVEGNGEILDKEHRRKQLQKHLDLHIDLLRQVYHCDYYGSTLCDFAEELARRSPKYLRRAPAGEQKPPEKIPGGEKIWAANLDAKQALLLRPSDEEMDQHGGKSVEKELLAMAARFSQQDEAEKHRCILKIGDGEGAEKKECGKPFKATIFVQKHVLNKHRALFEEAVGAKTLVQDIKYLNNYIRDPARVMPLQQQQLPQPDGALQNGGTNGTALQNGSTRLGPGAGGASVPGLIRMGNISAATPEDAHYSGVHARRPAPSSGAGPRHWSSYAGRDSPTPQWDLGAGRRRSASPPMRMPPTSAPGSLRDRLDMGPGGGRNGSAAFGLALGPPDGGPQKSLDPRARQAPKSYQDLDDGSNAAEEIELEY